MKKHFTLFCLILCLSAHAVEFQSVNVENFIRETWNPQTVILDVRTLSEYTEGHLAGAVLADFKAEDFIWQVEQQIPTNKRIAVYCRTGKRSKEAAGLLVEKGYIVTELDGGIVAWQAAKKRIVKGSPSDIERYAAHSYQANKQFAVAYRDTQVGEKDGDILVVYLHSGSACGIDNELPVRQRALGLLVDYLETEHINACVLVPQCRIDRRWNEYRPMQGCVMSEALYGLIHQYIKEHPAKDVYIVGESFGGAGVWRMLSDYPKMFSGGMLVASYPLKNVKPKNISKTPLCVVLGELDERAGTDKTEPVVKEIQQQRNSNVRYVVMQGADHYTTCSNAFSQENLGWLFTQSRQ